MPSRASTSKFSEKTAHIATISAADKGDHAPSSCKDESQVNSGDAVPRRRTRAAISRCVLLVPIVICPGQTFSCACTHSTSCNRVRPPPTSRCVQITRMMRTQYRCVPLFALSACMHMSCARTSLAPPALFIIAFPCTTSRVQGTPLPLPSESSPPPTQQKLGSRPTRRHFRHFSDSSAATPSAHACRNKIHTT